jgi:glycerol-3-phosphate dehydrogenase
VARWRRAPDATRATLAFWQSGRRQRGGFVASWPKILVWRREAVNAGTPNSESSAPSGANPGLKRHYDLAIVGGGVNGCGIARDAAGRGLSVYLCEQGDLASGTSSASTKLLHGGLRYLEHFAFRLVHEALAEREVVWGIAPHIVRPLRFVLPVAGMTRPAWKLRLGLFLYDHLGGRKLLPGARQLDLAADAAGLPLKPTLRGTAYEYSDCWIDDARLVALNARDAADRGATICARVKAIAAERRAESWRLTTEDQRTGARASVEARILVNAAGPWVDEVLTRLHRPHGHDIRLVQGSHIVVRRLYQHDRCYMLQNPDGRIVFAIPYEDDFTLIGTTDLDYVGDPAKVAPSSQEIAYLCESASRYFAAPVTPADVVWSYSGVRPLYADKAADGGMAQDATRDYLLELDDVDGAPILSVFGGKITTYRRLAESALAKLAPHLSASARAVGPWTGGAPLPGGDFPTLGLAALVDDLARAFPWLDPAEARRFAHSYGTRARRVLGDAQNRDALGRDFGATLSEAEVRYLMRDEFALDAEDVVWRRSKLGLRLSAPEIAALQAFMAEAAAQEPRA